MIGELNLLLCEYTSFALRDCLVRCLWFDVGAWSAPPCAKGRRETGDIWYGDRSEVSSRFIVE